ncbi:MAG: hypothetical protein MUC49_07185 [Raineya sp.]|jgi:hypothetical protein|nr:hypothetical protein [Raineya sp.]
MTPEEELDILEGKQESKEISFPMLFLEGLLYSILSFGLILGTSNIIEKYMPHKWFTSINAYVLLFSNGFVVIILASFIFALSKIGNGLLVWRVFIRTLITGLVCGGIVSLAFLSLFRLMIDVLDISNGIHKISNWNAGTFHFKETVIAFAAVFLMAYPILFMSVKYTLHRIFWSNEDELLA